MKKSIIFVTAFCFEVTTKQKIMSEIIFSVLKTSMHTFNKYCMYQYLKFLMMNVFIFVN